MAAVIGAGVVESDSKLMRCVKIATYLLGGTGRNQHFPVRDVDETRRILHDDFECDDEDIEQVLSRESVEHLLNDGRK